VSQNALADIAIAEGSLESAVAVSQRAREIADELLALDPENTFNVSTAISVDTALLEALIYQGELEQAERVMNRATRESRQLLEQDASVLEWAILDSKLQILDGKLRVARHTPDAATAALSATIARLDQLAAEHPANYEVRLLLAHAHAVAAEVHELRGDSAGMSTNVETVIRLLGPEEDRLPLRFLALLAEAYRSSGNSSRAAAIAIRLQDAGYVHPDNLRLTRE
jgi:tetratricopeptide (TPR) repeat protein